MAQLIAAQTTAATSSDFTVSSPLGISCYGAQGSEICAIIYRKNSDGTYSPLTSRIDPNRASVQVTLVGNIQDAFAITRPGTYKVKKPPTDGTVGIDTEG